MFYSHTTSGEQSEVLILQANSILRSNVGMELIIWCFLVAHELGCAVCKDRSRLGLSLNTNSQVALHHFS